MDSVQTALSDAQRKLQQLGPAPDAADVDLAEKRMVEIERRLAATLTQLDVESPPDSVSGQQFLLLQEKRKEVAREEAEEQKRPHMALLERHRQVLQLQEVVQLAQAALAGGDDAAGEADGQSLSQAIAAVGAGADTGPRSARYLKAARDRGVLQAMQAAAAESKESLDLSNRCIDWLPEPLARLGSVKVVDLSGNQIEVLPDVLGGLTSLTSLNLHANRLSTLPASIGLLSAMQSLDVSTNCLQRLPDSIVNCSALTSLNLNFNNLEKLPDRFGSGMPHLTRLSLALNKLTGMPDSIGDLASLTFLDLHFNRLQSLPSTIAHLSALHTLLLSDNFADLTDLPPALGRLSSLRHLDVRNNQVHALPVEMGRLTALERLQLEGNPWQSPPLDLVQCNDTYLVKLFLADRLREQQQLADAAVGSASWMAWFGSLLRDLTFVQWLNSVMAGTPMGSLAGPNVLGLEAAGSAHNGVEIPLTGAGSQQALVNAAENGGQAGAGKGQDVVLHMG
ncbi:hypothetical protein CLOM_g22148 [Closterium sp. NIES-68]|nr:hypothetical protein CLOM_g22148 [Closterium sp. NIES-68]GJP74505.1 hypothetical protein CLOP_g5072 [Closterium sp. NIES-67]